MTLPRGLYAILLTEMLEARLAGIDRRQLRDQREPMGDADAADRLALHVAHVVELALRKYPGNHRPSVLELVLDLGAGTATFADGVVVPLAELEPAADAHLAWA